ncbi:hypothetical protein ACFE04_011168 [Oxalis oulophora]
MEAKPVPPLRCLDLSSFAGVFCGSRTLNEVPKDVGIIPDKDLSPGSFSEKSILTLLPGAAPVFLYWTSNAPRNAERHQEFLKLGIRILLCKYTCNTHSQIATDVIELDTCGTKFVTVPSLSLCAVTLTDTSEEMFLHNQ